MILDAYDYSTPEKLLGALDNAIAIAVSKHYTPKDCTIIVPDALLDNVVESYITNPNTVATDDNGTYYKGYPVQFKFTHRDPIVLLVNEDTP